MVKRLALWASACLLLVSLIGGIFTFSLTSNLQPSKFKLWLRNARVYQKLPDILITQAASSSEQRGISLQDATVRKAAEQALSTDFITRSGDTIIDATGKWLTKQTPTADFNIDLLGAKEAFADNLIAQYRDRYEQLPFCESLPKTSDISKIDCRLERGDFDIDQALDSLRLQILEDQSFLATPTLSPETIADSSQSKTIYQIAALPTAYVWFQRLPLLFGAVALLCSIFVVLLCRSKRFGVRKIGWRLLVAGVVSILLGVAGYFLIRKLQSTLASLSTTSMYYVYRSLLQDLVRTASRDILLTLGLAAAGSTLVGGVVLIAVKDKKPKNPAPNTRIKEAPFEDKPFVPPKILDTSDSTVKYEDEDEQTKPPRSPKKHKRTLIQ